jgi:tRNA (guanosine-2'-O-)-methyltransferase
MAVEAVEDALPLSLLEPAREPTVLLLGHEHHGLPAEVLDLANEVVAVPMIGRGRSLS